MRPIVACLMLCLTASCAPAQESAAPRETALELVLLADASGSIDAGELAFQRQGYAEALRDPAVLAAIEGTLYGSIAVTYVEWATNQSVVAGWTLIDGPEAAEAFGAAILAGPRGAYGSNAIGAALLEGARLIEQNDIAAPRRVIDFSGDSMGNSSGPPIATAREAVVARGITINALPIGCESCPGRAGRDLERLYAEAIIGGPGAFLVTAETRARFGEALRRKLILEIAGPLGSGETRRLAEALR
ncbi:DUF1194 domain-containing protein [Pseudoroseicyclus aestuarii]|uniref:Uncharacterized protein DUF1194 n=1 Tax=Pseudoroseicyclus aestuarii TaxID=1795041 RepID=A0A318SUT7_9RHOB|nr:DUF1194 domain-containing protein [Pseudoroseicyclus aestuarii]PYE84036.1 uncharacterized protein DUF1194 [Pseudoroseicyclus aestuarii]